MNIVEHLRACAYNLSIDIGAGLCAGTGWHEVMDTFSDAADEIERLQEQLTACQKDRGEWESLVRSMLDCQDNQLATLRAEHEALLKKIEGLEPAAVADRTKCYGIGLRDFNIPDGVLLYDLRGIKK